ncbi:MAG: hypothetical protein SFX73_11600 [Kofleriaceae bacterium]|nr:hypothetical protein [Kofleriaceae bacterium]
MGKPAEDAMVAKAFDKAKHDELEEAIKKLSPDEAAYFLTKLEAAVRKRKIQLTGYLVSMFAWLAATIAALVFYGTYDGFTMWIFLVPFALVGLILFAFGAYADRVGAAAKVAPPPPGPTR